MTKARDLSQVPNASLGFKNRIINGAMQIDQRNNGASVTITGSNYTVDRWQGQATQTSKFTVQQNAGSVTPPSGFTNYLGVTSTSAYSITGNDAFQIAQIIEGFNIADLGWGTANAQPATLSFWVRSSLTGTFGGSIATTGSGVWVLPFSYTISSANTWTYITVAIPASSSALTNNNNTAGVFVRFGLGSTGTASGGTVGTWTNAGNYIQPSGTVSVVGTNGATFYITGVMLEKGSTATSYDYRPYGTELALCQRYCPVISGYMGIATGICYTSTIAGFTIVLPNTARTSPTGITLSSASDLQVRQNSGAGVGIGTLGLTGLAGTTSVQVEITGASGLVQGNATVLQSANSNLRMVFNGCEL
jgi:hypothetical protein